MDTGAETTTSKRETSADRDRLLASVALGCFWIVPVVGPLVLRAFMVNRPFALHYFRLSLIIQSVFVVGLGFSALNNIWPDASLWTGVISIPAWLWAVYGSIVCLISALRGEVRGLRPIPRSWIWAPAN